MPGNAADHGRCTAADRGSGRGGHEELLLGPLAVRGADRGKGIGIALMQAGIAAAQAGPWHLLVGDEPYYAKVGFARLPPGRVQFPGPVDQSRILGLSLKARRTAHLVGTGAPRAHSRSGLRQWRGYWLTRKAGLARASLLFHTTAAEDAHVR